MDSLRLDDNNDIKIMKKNFDDILQTLNCDIKIS